MTLVAMPFPELFRRRIAPLVATIAAILVALLAPASAGAMTYCVKPITDGCSDVFDTHKEALAAAAGNTGTDIVREQVDGEPTTMQVPTPAPTKVPKPAGPSIFDDVTNFM